MNKIDKKQGNKPTRKNNKRNRFKEKKEVIIKENIQDDYGDKDTKTKHLSQGSDLPNRSRYGNPNWYFTDRALADQASQFSFTSFIGNGELVDNAKMPSIMVIPLNPAIGANVASTNSTAAVNMVARKIYSMLATKSGRTTNYAPQDVMSLLLSLGEILSIVNHMKRYFGLTFTYNVRNRDFPKAMIKALGIDPDDFFTNLSVYRVKFNTLINTINKIPFPVNIAWFDKCSALYETVYKDQNSDLAGMYAFVPATSWLLDEAALDTGTKLSTINMYLDKNTGMMVSNKTFNDYLTSLQIMINNLLNSTTLNYIYADVLNSLSGDQLLHVDIIDELYSVAPQFDPEVLLHIHNMNILGMPTCAEYVSTPGQAEQTPLNDVYPGVDTNSLIYNPVLFWAADNVQDLESLFRMDIVDFPDGTPDITQRIESTRFALRTRGDYVQGKDANGTTGYYLIPASIPDHYPVSMIIFVNGVSEQYYKTVYATAGGILTTVPLNTQVEHMGKFDWSPLFYLINRTDNEIRSVFGDLNYWTKLDYDYINRINELSYQALFEIR